MALSVRDAFAREDALDLGSSWTLLYGAPEVLDHAVVVSNVAPAFTSLIALYAETLDSIEHVARARARLAGTGADDGVDLYARAELLAGASPVVLDKAYQVTLRKDASDDSITLTIYSLLSSSASPVELSSCVVTTLDTEASHNFMVKVRECERGAKIEVFIDDDVAPVLTYCDYATFRPKGQLVGFGLTDANNTRDVSLSDFVGYVVRSAAIHLTRPPVRLMNFGELKYHVGYRLDRNGNSQFPMVQIADFINFAQDEAYNELIPWKWAFRVKTFITKAGVSLYELWADAAMLYDITNQTLGFQLSKVSEQRLNRINPLREQTGGPYSFTVVGRGDFGGLVVRVDPVPSAAAVLEVPYYSKPVPMEEDSDIPLIPTNYLEILVLGALKRAAISDTDNIFASQVEKMWLRMMNRMKRANYTDLKESPRFRVANLELREKAMSVVGPVTRSQQLGL